MFTALFYAIGIAPILYELWKYYNFEILVAISDKLKNKENLDWDESFLCFCMLLYMVWTFIGLFSSQWFVFIFIIILSITHPHFKRRWVYRLDSVLTILAIIFMILNKYHFHLSISDIL